MNQWQQRKRPERLERRFEFSNYESTRNFLDKLGELTERLQRFPDISFGKTYVNITLRPDDDSNVQLTDADHAFSLEIDALVD